MSALSPLPDEGYDNLVQWGGALLELSMYESGVIAQETLRVAIERLELAREVDNGGHHENLWLLGFAHDMRSQILPRGDALRQVDKERSDYYFLQAKNLDPTNDLYIKSDQNTIQTFLVNKLMWSGVAAAGVLACVWKYVSTKKE